MNALHSKLGASSYSRWKACPGSVNLCEGIPSTTSVYAEEGTHAHAWASHLLDDTQPRPEERLNDEAEAAVEIYLEHVAKLRAFGPAFEAVEQRLDLSKYHPALFGTADYVCYFADKKELHVVDYKHGAGVAVDVVENEQLMYYGLGALHQNKLPIKKVVLTIVQPRCYHQDGPVRSWETDPITMLDYAATLVEDAIATEKPDAPLIDGGHCRWCNAQAICPKVHEKSITTAQSVFEATTGSYDPRKLADTLRQLDQIEAWCKAVRSFAYTEAEAGRVPPGFKLVDKRASRKWKENTTVLDLIAVFKGLPKDQFTETKIKSPAQVEKFLSKTDKPKLEALTVKESSGKNLVPEDDSRIAIAPKIKDVFEVIP